MSQVMIVPDGTGELHEIETLVGTTRQKLTAMLISTEDMAVEMSEAEYSMLRPVMLATDVDFTVVIDVPDIPTPRSFLLEELSERVLSFNKFEEADKSMATAPTLSSLMNGKADNLDQPES